MDTFLYIVIAVAIMAYQIYNEKKKKEQKGNAVNRPPLPRVDPNEQLHKEFSQMFGFSSIVNDLEETHGEESEEDIYAPVEIAKPSVPLAERKKYMGETLSTMASEAKAYNVDVPINKTHAETTQLLSDIYDSSEISDFNSQEESVENLDKDFDPRLFILYSEIAQPKFKD